MKKPFFVAIAAFMALSVSLSAGEVQGDKKPAKAKKEKAALTYKVFNHMGIGVSVGTMQGASAQIAFPVTPYLQLRGGYGLTNFFYSYETNFDLGKIDVTDKRTLDLTNVPVKLSLTPSYYGLVDLYFTKKASFHLTAGIVGSNNGDIFNASIDLSGPNMLEPDEFGKLAITYKNDDETATLTVSSDDKGFVNAGVRAKNAIHPYFGLGWGRGANIKHRVSCSLDLGFQYTGGTSVFVNDWKNSTDHLVTSALVDHKDSFDGSDLPVVGSKIGKVDDAIDKAANGDLPFKVGGWLPVIKFGINVRLF